jgi:hypothetical protein
MARTLLVALLALLAWTAVPEAGTRGAHILAEDLETEEDECRFVLMLCDLANNAIDRAGGTPGTRTALSFKHDAEVALRLEDIDDAVRVIRKKHGGKNLPCFKDDACDGLID